MAYVADILVYDADSHVMELPAGSSSTPTPTRRSDSDRSPRGGAGRLAEAAVREAD